MRDIKKVIVVAIGTNYAIGLNGRMPWTLQRADMKHFVDLTMGFPIIMGRKTYESFPRRPLPNRTNIVITHQAKHLFPECVVVDSLERGINVARSSGKDKAFIIGGAQVYTEALPIADEIELTLIHHEFPCDTRFPSIDTFLTWRETHRTDYEPDEKNQYKYSFIRLERVRKG